MVIVFLFPVVGGYFECNRGRTEIFVLLYLSFESAKTQTGRIF